mmetsp:Transcript_23952/g.66528  ORF Transcript_23952/g.66528 Transcript_23952/m.66528 type:complete len:459 (+) Transcript_23952:105-1481(+)
MIRLGLRITNSFGSSTQSKCAPPVPTNRQKQAVDRHGRPRRAPTTDRGTAAASFGEGKRSDIPHRRKSQPDGSEIFSPKRDGLRSDRLGEDAGSLPLTHDPEPLPPWHRLTESLSLPGSGLRFFLYCVVWLVIGTAYYATVGFHELPPAETPMSVRVASGFYYAVEAGLSIGFGKLSEVHDGSRIFTILYVLYGSLLAAIVLAAFVVRFTDRLKRKMRLSCGKSSGLQENQEDVGRTVASILLCAILIAVGTAFGVINQGWTIPRSIYFAVTGFSTGGLQQIMTWDPFSFAFTGALHLLGVPAYAYAITCVSETFARFVLHRRHMELKHRSAQEARNTCETESVLRAMFKRFDLDHSGYLDRQELSIVIAFFGHLTQDEVTEDDIDYFMEEFDMSEDGLIDEDEFVAGMMQWIHFSRVERSSMMGRSGSAPSTSEAFPRKESRSKSDDVRPDGMVAQG